MGWFLPSLFGAAVQGVQSLFGASTQNKNVDRTIRANKQQARLQYRLDRRMADYQYGKDLEMWNRQNQYNSPEMQMERLRNANLNPNMVYGSGAVANSAGPSPKYEGAKYQAPTLQYNYVPMVDLPSVISAYQDMQLKQAQIDNMKAQREAINMSTANKELAHRFGEYTFPYRSAILGNKAIWGDDVMLAQLKKIQQEVGQKGELFPYQLQFAEGKNRQQSTDIQRMLTGMEKTKLETEMLKYRTDYFVTQLIGKWGVDIGRLLKGFSPGKGRTKGLQNPFGADRAFNNTTRRFDQFAKKHKF